MPNVIFYNFFHAGDIFESREFVKECMDKISAENYYYAHQQNPKILADLPQLVHIPVTDKMNPRSPVAIIEDTIYINTWIGWGGGYVLPGIGCTVEKLYEMYNDTLRKLNLPSLSKAVFDYIPSIDYSYYNIEPVNKFLQEFKERKVLISNGKVYSNQAENFDFTPAIDRLAYNLHDVIFILTEAVDISSDNIFFTSDIINNEDNFDLNEISYLSLFCDTHIGRNSGPHVFAQVKENWLDPNKISLSFTRVQGASHFVWKLPTKMSKWWSGSIDMDGVYKAMYGAVERL
jgi:hypothetical protein